MSNFLDTWVSESMREGVSVQHFYFCGPVKLWYHWWCVSRHVKSRKHASTACGRRHFWINKECLVFAHQCPQVCIIIPNYLIHFCLKIFDLLEKIGIYDTLICLGNIWICGHFAPLKIGFRTKINFFHDTPHKQFI